nr:MAG TPA: hypothetical protein [Caudoviricetes sp.]
MLPCYLWAFQPINKGFFGVTSIVTSCYLCYPLNTSNQK